MNKLTRSALALCVGFAGTTAILQAAGPSRDDPPPTVIGPLDMSRYCRAAFDMESGAVLVGQTEYGWRCATRPNGLFELVEFNFDDACRVLYDVALSARNWDPGNAYAWECIEP